MLLSKRRINKIKTSWHRLPGKLATIKNLAGRKIADPHFPMVAFKVSGGLGDHIIAARFIRDFCSTTGIDRYDIYCTKPAILKWLLSASKKCSLIGDAKACNKTLSEKYGLTLNVTTALSIENYKPAEVSEKFPILPHHINKIRIHSTKIEPTIEHHPYLDGYLGHYAALLGYRRHNHLHAMADIRYGGNEIDIPTDESILLKLGLKAKSYITVSNGFDLEFHSDTSKCPTKVYPRHNDVIRHLKRNIPGVKFIHVGSVAGTPLDECDMNLVNATSLTEVASLLKHSLHHLDNEGGLVHMAASLRTPCTVVFGPTLSSYFGYEENINIAPVECGGCWWMERDWMSRCIRGFDSPPCMQNQAPEVIANRIYRYLMESTQTRSEVEKHTSAD